MFEVFPLGRSSVSFSAVAPTRWEDGNDSLYKNKNGSGTIPVDLSYTSQKKIIKEQEILDIGVKR